MMSGDWHVYLYVVLCSLRHRNLLPKYTLMTIDISIISVLLPNYYRNTVILWMYHNGLILWFLYKEILFKILHYSSLYYSNQKTINSISSITFLVSKAQLDLCFLTIWIYLLLHMLIYSVVIMRIFRTFNRFYILYLKENISLLKYLKDTTWTVLSNDLPSCKNIFPIKSHIFPIIFKWGNNTFNYLWYKFTYSANITKEIEKLSILI